MLKNDRPTIAATGRRRFHRLRVVYPDHSACPAYDTALARELLARTGELPASKRGLVALLTEYRHALHALASRPREHDGNQRQLSAPPQGPARTDAGQHR